MRVNTNVASLNIYRAYSKNLAMQSTALGRISSGLKINSAKDNPNALAQSERLRLQIRGLQMAAQNDQDGISMLQTTQGGLEGITSNFHRVRELIMQSSGTTTLEDRTIIQGEIDQMLKGAMDMAKDTNFNGVNLLVGGANDGTVNIPTTSGANVGEKMDIPKLDITFAALDLVKIDVTDETKMNDSIKCIDDAINLIITARSKFGAIENRFQSAYTSKIEIAEKVQAAESSIRDTDIAEEMMEFAKNNLLVEAGNALMVQSNNFPKDVLKILNNIR